MKRLIVSLIFIAVFIPKYFLAQSAEYPETKSEPVIDTFYNHYLVEDKYRWLEDVYKNEVTDWIKIQNKFSHKYLSKVSNDYSSYSLIDKYAYIEYKYLRKIGKYYFSKSVLSGSGTPALFYRKSIDSHPNLLVDPNSISVKDIITLKNYFVSGDSKLLAYQFSRNGSDREELKVISIGSGFHKKDHLTNLRFTQNIAWKGDGFFYSKYAKTDYFEKVSNQEVYFHKIETEQNEDELIFSRDNSESYFNFLTTSNERYFVLIEHKSNKQINAYYIDYTEKEPKIKALITNFDGNFEIIDNCEDKFIGVTTYNSPNGSIVEINPLEPYKWRQIAAQYKDAVLSDVFPMKDRIIATYQTDLQPFIIVYDYNGEVLRNIRFPAGTSVGGFSGRNDENELLYYYSSYTVPPVVYKFNPETFEQNIFETTKVTYDYSSIEYKSVEYLSKDSTLIPMILVYEKGLKLDGNNPTVLKAYGGFGISEKPSFDPGIVYFVKQGGVFAFAKVRGGGEKGKEWAKQGRGSNKQTTFNDFISAAEYLISSGYTSSNKLAATGTSNGGLVVAVAAIQRPDLFKAVVPVVAPLDMLRFDKYTGGKYWKEEYGNINDSLGFVSLFSYSPYHNIKDDVNYPSMLIMTSDADDRVAPFHSYKFVARLQNRKAQTNPVLLRVQKKSGHYGASSLLSWIEEEADMYGFIMKELKGEE